MTSSLASQLIKLQERPVNDRKLSQSFLFTNADAKQLSREQVLEVCLAGLRTLLNVDNRFHAYLPTLFDTQSTRRERSMLTHAEEKTISRLIDEVLVLLSPHLLLTCSHQVFEYLVRVWEVQTYNVQSVLQAFLPFHDHAVFGRAVTLLDLRDTGFEMLKENQLHAAPLLGSQLRQLCGESRKALRTVLGVATKAQAFGVVNGPAFALVCGVGSSLATHQDGESLFRSLLPVVHELLTGNSEDGSRATDAACRRECMSTALLLLCAWSHEVQFGAKVLSSLLRPLVEAVRRADLPLPLRDVLAVLGILFRTQRRSLGDVALSSVIRGMLDLPWREWAPLLPPGTHDLISRLVEEVVQTLGRTTDLSAVPRATVDFLLAAAESLPLREVDIYSLLESIVVAEEAVSGAEVCLQAAAALERRFSVHFDKHITKLLSTVGGDKKTNVADKTMWFVQRRLEGNTTTSNGAAAVVDLQGVQVRNNNSLKGRRYLPLTMCLLHHLPEVRLAALQQITSMTEIDERLLNSMEHAMRFEQDRKVCLAWQKAAQALLTQKQQQKGTEKEIQSLVHAMWAMVENTVQQSSISDAAPIAVAFLEAIDVLLVSQTNGKPKSAASGTAGGARGKKQKGLQVAEDADTTVEESDTESMALPLLLITTLREMYWENKDVVAACMKRLASFASTASAAASSSALGLSSTLCEDTKLLKLLASAASNRLGSVCEQALQALRQGANISTEGSNNKGSASLELSMMVAIATATSDVALLRRLLAFFAPHRAGSYLSLVKEVETEASSKLLSSGQFTTGRGAKSLVGTTILAHGGNAAPSLNDVAVHVAATLQSVLHAMLASTTALVTKEALELNDMLGNPLPQLSLAPAALAPLYWALLASTSRTANWYPVVRKAVTDAPTAALAAADNCPTGPAAGSVAALGLFLPLFAANGEVDVPLARQAQQLAVGLGSMTWAAAVKKGGLHACLYTVLKGSQPLSMTSVSSLIEVVALSSTEATVKSQPLPESAATTVCQWILSAAIPLEAAVTVIRTCFPLQAPTSTPGEAVRRSLANLELLVSSLQSTILPSLSASAMTSLSTAEGNLIRAVLQRLTLTAATPSHVALAEAVLRKGYVHIGGESVAVYLYALDALHQSFEAHYVPTTTSSVLFKAKPKTTTKSKDENEFNAQRLGTVFGPLVLELWSRHGADAATLLAASAGAFETVLMQSVVPSTLTIASPNVDNAIKLLQDVLSVFTNAATPQENAAAKAVEQQQAGSWTPSVTLSQLPAVSAKTLLDALSSILQNKNATLATQNEILRVTALLLQVAPSIVFDENADEDAINSLYHFVQYTLQAVPLHSTLPLWEAANSAETTNTTVSKVGALAYFKGLCALPTLSEAMLDASVPQGARLLRQALVKDVVALLAELFAETAEKGSDAGVLAAIDLLRAASPLLSVPSSNNEGESATEEEAAYSLLHLPVLSLFFQLHRMQEADPASLQFQTATDLCVRVVTGFDITHQVRCVSGLLRLMAAPEDPAASTRGTLRSAVGSEDHTDEKPTAAAKPKGKKGSPATTAVAEDTDNAEWTRVKTLCEKLVKTNKIINRQEEILSLIGHIVKSDAYLEGFLRIQLGHSFNDAAAGAEDPTLNLSRAVNTAERSRQQQDCMVLLISSLNLYAHYHTMVEDYQQQQQTESEDSEEFQYVQLLQLLAGNTLACILAAINEPTFVECQRRLLSDSRVLMQRKGLETLLDRLHQSLPTSEFVLSSEQMDAQRRAARDPKKKMTPEELLKLRSRPLTTKRTATLIPRILTISTGALQEAPTLFGKAATLTAKQQEQLTLLFSVGQLGAACLEELVRIVGSGGSQAAETALAHGLQNTQHTEAALSKLFGNKCKVQEVHNVTTTLLTQLRSALEGIESAPAAAFYAAADTTSQATALLCARMHVASTLLTSLSTIAQVMGIAFMSEHVIDTLDQFSKGLHRGTQRSVAPQGMSLHPDVSAAQKLLRLSALNSMIRALTCTWHMCHPYIPSLLGASSHLSNVEDSDTAPLAAQLLATLQALLEPRLMLEGCCDALLLPGDQRVSPATHSFVVLFGCLEGLVTRMTKSDLAGMSVLTTYDELAPESAQRNVWIAALQHLASSSSSLPALETMEAVYRAYVAFFVKFKATQCTAYFGQLIAWGFAEQSRTKKPNQKDADEDEETDPREDAVPKRVVHRWIVTLGLYNHLLKKLQALADFTFSTAMLPIVHLLASYSSSSKAASKSIHDSITAAIEMGLETVRQMALAQVELGTSPSYFATTDVFNSLMPALIRQVQNTVYLEDASLSFAVRIDRFVLPAVRAFMKAVAAPKLWSATQGELLKLLRSPSPLVRRATLTVLRGVYADGGDEMAAMMLSEVLPSVVEATEDQHDSVIEEARLFCNELSVITGSDVLHAMS